MRSREGGSALVETILVGLVLMVPAIWMLAVLSQAHQAALASTAAVRSIGEGVSILPGSDPGPVIERSVRRSFVSHGLDPAPVRVGWDAPDGTARGATVSVAVSYPVEVLGFPLLGSLDGFRFWVDARHTFLIQRYASVQR